MPRQSILRLSARRAAELSCVLLERHFEHVDPPAAATTRALDRLQQTPASTDQDRDPDLFPGPKCGAGTPGDPSPEADSRGRESGYDEDQSDERDRHEAGNLPLREIVDVIVLGNDEAVPLRARVGDLPVR